jgi:hypothetical protein
VGGEVGALREVLPQQAVGRSYVCQAALAALIALDSVGRVAVCMVR